ncbi:DNA repair protein recO [Alkalidesulfovibrio alkalitolerans DSM 16529]|jgi:DNA repair protein RecO (recombination protein O)|uniref:DNA repair protein RecO n=1 Tax=Alkalidesulfovibrio alkalitolerans DSM 16529 TaxID=1121439 RepID=S7T1L2_9BACT|nr:DNA repair protein RecO [Alkalidesulfovibrio alkalitolerans]EPR30441.1 DNA repair protein recO [Alkalidesulfovibrio alkalitolerans DSM 16529]
MEFTERALVLRTGRFREADMWVRLIGPTRGLFQAFAFGGCRSRRRFGGCLDTFNLVMATAATDRAGRYLHLRETTLVRAFPRLRHDLARLGMAANCLAFAEAVQDGAQSAGSVFDALLGTLDLLDVGERLPEGLPMFFRTRALAALGYWPELQSCHVCGKGLHDMPLAFLAIDSGRLSCPACGWGDLSLLRLGQEAVSTLRFLSRSDPGGWPDLDVSPTARRECFAAVDRFIEYHLGLAWDAGRYRRA